MALIITVAMFFIGGVIGLLRGLGFLRVPDAVVNLVDRLIKGMDFGKVCDLLGVRCQGPITRVRSSEHFGSYQLPQDLHSHHRPF